MGGRKYSDPDVISLIRATGELVDPRSAVVNQARKLNCEYRSYDGDQASPMKRLEIIASLCGLTISSMNIERRRAEPRDAVLILSRKIRGNRGQILYNPQRPQGRVAFSIAHEISHTFFPNTMTGARFRDICGSDSREANELERLCDLAASELLMPLEEFRGELRGQFTLANVEALTEKFGSSFEATVFRLATAHPGIAVAGLLRYRLRRGEERALATSAEQLLFQNMKHASREVPEPKYRRQSFFSSTAASAQFGFGIVYDPTNYANAVLRYSQLVQQLNQLRQTYTQIVQQYNLAVQMARNLQNMPARYQAQFSQWRNVVAPNTYGNTGTWVNGMNTGLPNAVNAGYQQATTPLLQYNGQVLSGMTPDDLDRVKSQYASVELSDGANVTAMAAIGAIRDNAQTIQNQINNLEQDSLSSDPNLAVRGGTTIS